MVSSPAGPKLVSCCDPCNFSHPPPGKEGGVTGGQEGLPSLSHPPCLCSSGTDCPKHSGFDSCSPICWQGAPSPEREDWTEVYNQGPFQAHTGGISLALRDAAKGQRGFTRL